MDHSKFGDFLAFESSIRRLESLQEDPTSVSVLTALSRLQSATRAVAIHLPDPQLLALMQRAKDTVERATLRVSELRVAEQNGLHQKRSVARGQYSKIEVANQIEGFL